MKVNQPTKQRVCYKRPPLIERALSVTAEMSEEVFFTKLDKWSSIVQEEFPIADPMIDWTLNIEQDREGNPVFKSAKPQMRIRHRFWRTNKRGDRFLSLKFDPGQFVINLHPEKDNPHNFEDAADEFGKWLPRWLNHFEIAGCNQLTLHYVNLISPQTTPQFVGENGGLQIGRVITVLAGIPGNYKQVIPPYNCEVSVVTDIDRMAAFRLRVAGLFPESGHEAGVRVDFVANVNNRKYLTTPNEVLSQAQYLHTLLNEQFDNVFTAEARRSFEPVAND